MLIFVRQSLTYSQFEPLPDSDDDNSDDDEFSEEDEVEENTEDDDEERSTNGKRRSSDEGIKVRKRRKVDKPVSTLDCDAFSSSHFFLFQVYRVTRDEVYQYKQKLNKYYYAGTSYGQSAASTIYILATILERVDNDLLW